MIFKVALLFMDKVEDGARSSIFLATSPEVQHVTGKFYSNKAKPEKPAKKYYSIENEKNVRDYCLRITEGYTMPIITTMPKPFSIRIIIGNVSYGK